MTVVYPDPKFFIFKKLYNQTQSTKSNTMAQSKLFLFLFCIKMPPHLHFLLSLILLLNVRHEKNANGRKKYQLETKVLWKADCPISKDSTRFDPPYITSTITTTSTKYGLKLVTRRSNDQLTQWRIQCMLIFFKSSLFSVADQRFMNLNPNIIFFLNLII